jgi:hypothetical protein
VRRRLPYSPSPGRASFGCVSDAELDRPVEVPVEEEDFLLDRIDALRVLRADTPEEKERLLEEIGGSGGVEQDIVSELSKPRPLWRPERFEEAHRNVIRGALENVAGVVVFAAVVVAVLGSLAWVALYAASVARVRIRLSASPPSFSLASSFRSPSISSCVLSDQRQAGGVSSPRGSPCSRRKSSNWRPISSEVGIAASVRRSKSRSSALT